MSTSTTSTTTSTRPVDAGSHEFNPGMNSGNSEFVDTSGKHNWETATKLASNGIVDLTETTECSDTARTELDSIQIREVVGHGNTCDNFNFFATTKHCALGSTTLPSSRPLDLSMQCLLPATTAPHSPRRLLSLDELVQRLQQVNCKPDQNSKYGPTTTVTNSETITLNNSNGVAHGVSTTTILSIDELTLRLRHTNYLERQWRPSSSSTAVRHPCHFANPFSTELTGTNGRSIGNELFETASVHKETAHHPKLPLTEFLGRLVHVNKQTIKHSSTSKLDQRLRRLNRHHSEQRKKLIPKKSSTCSLEQILDRHMSSYTCNNHKTERLPIHLPMSDDRSTLSESGCSQRRNAVHVSSPARREKCRSLCNDNSVDCFDGSCEVDPQFLDSGQRFGPRAQWVDNTTDSYRTEEDCDDDDSDDDDINSPVSPLATMSHQKHLRETTREKSPSFEELYECRTFGENNVDEESEFSLRASLVSCDSSLTWDADMDEITVDDDDGNESQLETHFMDNLSFTKSEELSTFS